MGVLPRWRTGLRVAVMAVTLPVLGLVLAIAAELVPDGRIAYSLVRSIDRGDLTVANYDDTGLGNHIDRFGDCIVLTNGLGDRDGSSIVESAVASPTLGSCTTAVPLLEGFRETEVLDREYDYFRYWHGYGMFLRPSLAAFGVTTTRALAAVALMLAAGALATACARLGARSAGIALLAPLVVASDWWDLPESLLHAVTMTTLLASAAALAHVWRRSSSLGSMAAAAAIGGAVFAYLDLFSIPVAAWVLVIGTAGIVAHLQGHRVRQIGQVQAVAGCGWIVGYVWMWLAKWLIAAPVLGWHRVWDDVAGQARERVSGRQADVSPGLGHATIRNLDAWIDRPLGSAVTVAVIGLLAGRLARLDGGERRRRLLLLVPTLMPFAWWELVSNHSQIHAWFTYRSIAVCLGLVAAVALLPDATHAGHRCVGTSCEQRTASDGIVAHK